MQLLKTKAKRFFFSLRKKIIIGYGMALVLTLFVIVWAVMNLYTLGKASDAVLRENYNSILAAGNMLAALNQQESAALLLILGEEDIAISMFRKAEGEFFEWLGRAKDNVTIAGEETVVNTVDIKYSDFLLSLSRLQILHAESSPTADSFYVNTVAPALDSARAAIIRLRELNQETMFQASATARKVATRAEISTILIGLAAVLLGIGFSTMLANLISRPIQNFLDATRRISEGDYNARITVKSRDELGHLAGEFNAMISKVQYYHEMNIGNLLAEKNKSEAIIQSIDDGLLFLDSQYRIINMNPAAARMLDTQITLTEGKHFLEVLHNDELFKSIKDASETGNAVTPEHGQNVLTIERDENRFYYEYAISPVTANSEVAVGVLLLLRDVTRLKEVDMLKSQFVMTASHELRTPIASALMSVDLLVENAMDRLTEKESQLLKATQEDMHRLRALVNDLLELSKIESGKIEMVFEETSLQQLVEKSVILLKRLADELKIDLSYDIPESIPPIKMDPNKVAWVLTNLVSNAFRYTDPGGFIKIFAEHFGAQVHLSVQDNGTGIPYEYQSRIFDKFVQVKSTRENGGSGLGLAICKEIVRAHGGTIWVDSVPGEGSTFTFTLPIAVS